MTWSDYNMVMLGYPSFTDVPAKVQIEKLVNGEEEVKEIKIVSWPPSGFSVPIKSMAYDTFLRAFLQRRRLSLDFCADMGVRIGLTGKLTNRFLMPVFEDGKVVAYQGRDMSESSDMKYYSSDNMSLYLYGYDDVRREEKIVIVEGIFDSWRVDNSVATFGTNISSTQLKKLFDLRPAEIVLAWDIGEDGSDAYWVAYKKMKELSDLFGCGVVSMLTLPVGKDPDDLGEARMKELLDSKSHKIMEIVGSK